MTDNTTHAHAHTHTHARTHTHTHTYTRAHTQFNSPLFLHFDLLHVCLRSLLQSRLLFPWRHRPREGEDNILPLHAQLCHIGDLNEDIGIGRKVAHTDSEHILEGGGEGKGGEERRERGGEGRGEM